MLGPANSIHLQRWVRGVSSRGHEVHVISQHASPVHDELPASSVTRLPFRGPVGYFTNARALSRCLAALRPDLLHVHYASGYGTTAALARFTPALLSVWGSDVYEFPYRSALHGRLLRHNLRRSTAIAATSLAMAEQVRRLTPDRAEVAVTPFGVDLRQFSPNEAKAARSGITIGIVKSLAPVYGIDLLLQAFAGLRRDPDLAAAQPGLRLEIVGEGPERAALEGMAGTLGVAAACRFVGAAAHASVPQRLRGFDIFAAPSRRESFGVAVIEAGACGLPAVVSDAGGLPEVVLNGITGLVVPAGDPIALQAALKRLVLDTALRERLGRAAHQHVVQTYDWERSIDRMLACYEAVIGRGRSAAP
jgi:glycosyltransferase involved in cell wall biosynthesis